MNNSTIKNLDWVSMILCLLLINYGRIVISSTIYSDLKASLISDLNRLYGRQLLFIALSFSLILFILAIDSKLYINLAVTFYLITIVLLVGLFVFGKGTNGARAWYAIGSTTVQPSKFAKVATVLAFSRYVNSIHTNVRRMPDLLHAITITYVPSSLILLQPNIGSLLVFFSLLLILFRERMPSVLLFYLFLAGVIFTSSLELGAPFTLLVSALCIDFYVFWHKRRTSRMPFANLFILSSICLVTALTTHPVYENVLKQHHHNRLNLWLHLETDPQKIAAMKHDSAYNMNMAESATTSGDTLGKGFLQGTRTKDSFISERHTDYISTTIGEEQGFAGTTLVIILFVSPLLRLLQLAERQRTRFSRAYGYCVVSILFVHFCINIGMVISLIPAIGILLPSFNYGDSRLWAFTILLFIFLRLDARQ